MPKMFAEVFFIKDNNKRLAKAIGYGLKTVFTP